MKQKKFLIFFLTFFYIFQILSVSVFANTTKISPDISKELYGKSALLMDTKSGRVLYEKNGYEMLPMASTTKIMTCIYTLEHGNLNDIVTISKNAAVQPKVRLGVTAGEQYLLKDLLYALMLESYNDCAVAIAEHISGSVSQFCYDMSNKARDLGAYNTTFETPNGLDSDNHKTTAYDLALITRYAVSNKDFLTITNTRQYSFQEQTKNRSHSIQNKNAFLDQYKGAYGVKTGFTGKAGYCFVGASKQGEKDFISVTLASGWPPNKGFKWQDTKKLMDFGFQNFDYKTVGVKQPKLEKIPVVDGTKSFLSLDTKVKQETLLLKNTDEFDIKIILPKTVTAPIQKGMPIGSIIYSINGEEVSSYSIYTKESIDKITYPFYFHQIFRNWLIK